MTASEAAATGRPLGVGPAETQALATPMYQIRKSFAVVHFEPAGQGRIVFLPEGAELEVVGPSCLCGCFEVLCENRLYNMFQADLLGPWANPIAPCPNRDHPIPGRERASA
jgi:hypothetical protein